MDHFVPRNAFERRTLQEQVDTRQSVSRISSALQQQLAQSEAQTAAMIAASRDLASSNSEGFRLMAATMEDVAENLISAIEPRLTEIVEELRIHTVQFAQILDALQKPKGTRARETWDMAQADYARKFFDNAKKHCHECIELNPSDFLAYEMLGRIALHDGDLDEARKWFETTAKYAQPVSAPFTARALLSQATVWELKAQYELALKYAESALDCVPGLPEGLYATGKYLAATGEPASTAKRYLVEAFWMRPGLTVLALRDQLLGLHEAIRDEAIAEYRDGLTALAQQRLSSFALAIEIADGFEFLNNTVEQAKSKLNHASRSTADATIVSLLEALELVPKSTDSFFSQALDQSTKKLRSLEEQVTRAKHQAQEMRDAIGSRVFWWVAVGAVLLALLPLGSETLLVRIPIGGVMGFVANTLVARRIQHKKHGGRRQALSELIAELQHERKRRKWVTAEPANPPRRPKSLLPQPGPSTP